MQSAIQYKALTNDLFIPDINELYVSFDAR